MNTTTLDPDLGPLPINDCLRGARQLGWLVRAVWLQALRRNELYVALILMGLYLLAALVLRVIGIDKPQTARFITDLGLEWGALLTALLVIAVGARQIPGEIELRTIYPILAKPVTRAQVLLGKGLPTWLTGLIMLLLFDLVTLAVTPRLPWQHTGVLAQAVLLQTASLAMLTALTLFVSLWLPVGVAMLAAGGVYFLGGTAASLLMRVAGLGGGARLFAGLIPDFSLLGQFGRYVDGGAFLAAGALLGLLAYAALWTLLFSGLAVWRFRRMAL